MILFTFDLIIKKGSQGQKQDAGGSEKPLILLPWPKWKKLIRGGTGTIWERNFYTGTQNGTKYDIRQRGILI